MKKILFLLVILLCFVGCENPNLNIDNEQGQQVGMRDYTTSAQFDPQVLFYGFIPAGHYVFESDAERSCDLTDKNELFFYWGGVKQEVQRDIEGFDKYDVLDGFKEVEKTDKKLVLEMITLADDDSNWDEKEVYSFIKLDSSINLVYACAYKEKGEETWEELEEEFSCTFKEGEKSEPKFLVEYDNYSGKWNQVCFYFNTNFKETGTIYDVVVTTKDGQKVDNDTLEFGTFMPQFLEISGFKEGEYFIKLHFKNDNWEDDLIKTYELTVEEEY